MLVYTIQCNSIVSRWTFRFFSERLNTPCKSLKYCTGQTHILYISLGLLPRKVFGNQKAYNSWYL